MERKLEMLTFNDYAELAERERAHRREYGKPGIYGIFLNGECLYVGKSKNCHYRFTAHAQCFSKKIHKRDEYSKKYLLLKPYIKDVEWKVLEFTTDIDEAEKKWIKEMDNPLFNIQLGGKSQHFEGDAWDIEQWMSGEISYNELKKRTVK